MRRQQRISITQPLNRNRIAAGVSTTSKAQASGLQGLAAYDDDSASESGSPPPQKDTPPLPDTKQPTQAPIPLTTTATSNDVEDEFAAFMADINAEVENLAPAKNQPTVISEPIPVSQSTDASTPVNLPAFAPTCVKNLFGPPTTHALRARIERVNARLDQLPAFPVTLPEPHMKAIAERRIEFSVRCNDWTLGGLSDAYFQAVVEYFEALTDSVEDLYCPVGWQIHFDEATESHYFQCLANDRVSWSWPEIPPIVSFLQPRQVHSSELAIEVREADTVRDRTPVPEPALASPEENPSSVTTRKLFQKPQNVSVSAKSKKLAGLLQKWHTVKAEVAAEEEADEAEEAGEGEEELHVRLQSWAQSRAEVDTGNPNFTPVVPRSKRQRVEKDA
ncbi:hypothetical protein BC830DRAFT_1155337 [Chytriomyces sp. MP71]|nr:hypothetical protein BC830DRAFT_1155337 [Chytriomyces sp. MP71]